MSQASQADQAVDKIRAATEDEQQWVKVQKKTFLRWCQIHLRKRGMKIEDLQTGFNDGINMIHLMAQLYDLPIPRYNKNAKMRAHIVDNVSIGLGMVEQAGVHVHGIKTISFLDENLKMILGTVWQIIHHYQIQGISVDEMNAREGLLLWCQRKTKPYDNVSIKNFGSSWKDGLGFCALIHAHAPSMIDYKSLSKDDPARNLQLAFDVAEEKFGIPKYLDVEDMMEDVVDEKSVMTYLSEYFKVFAAMGDSETAGRRVQKFIEFNQGRAKLVDEYEAKARALTAWMDGKKAELAARPEVAEGDTDVAAAKEQLAQYWRYKTLEKPEKSVEKFEAQNVHDNLQTKLRVFARAPYIAPAGIAQGDVSRSWEELGDAEQGRLSALQDYLAATKENLRLAFANAANSFVQYMGAKEAAVNGVSGEFEEQLATVNALKEEITFEGQTQLKAVADVNTAVAAAGIKDNKHTDLTLEEVGLIWEELNAVLQAKVQHIENMLARKADKERIRAEQEAIERAREALRVAFADKANALAPWIEAEKNALAAADAGGSLEEQLERVNGVLGKTQEGDGLVHECVELDERLVKEGVRDNKHTEYTVGELQLLWDEVLNGAANKKTLLENKQARRAERERVRQEAETIEAANENLRLLFADKARGMDECVKGIQGQLQPASDQALDAQLQRIRDAEEAIAGSQAQLTELAGIHQRVQDAGIVSNPHTALSFEELSAAHAELGKQAEMRAKFLEGQLELKNKNDDIPEATLAEYKATFAKFDKDKSGALTKSEFKACVGSLGQMLKDDELDVLVASVDKSGDGTITLDEFVGYMVERTKDTDTPAQVKDAFKFLAQNKDFCTHDDLIVAVEPEKTQWFFDTAPQKEEAPGAVDYVAVVDNSYA